MKVHDPRTIAFDGTPITGRTPPRVLVDGGRELTQAQFSGVQHAYKLFRDALGVSITDFMVQNRVLKDGTRVRMESMQDQDTVYVWPTGEDNRKLGLPHGFAVVTNWQVPKIFKRAAGVWKFARDTVPQIKLVSETNTFDNQAFRLMSTGFVNLPFVLRKAKTLLWDYAQRSAPVALAGTTALAFRIKNAVSGKFTLTPPHFAAENKIIDVAGTVLYTMADAAPILAPSAPEYPENVHYLPSATDAEGNQLAMQQWRYAIISPSTNIWQFRLCNERIRRTGDLTYAYLERNSMDYTTPWGKQTATTYDVTDYDLGESAETNLYFRWTSAVAVQASGLPFGWNTIPLPPALTPGSWRWSVGWTGTNDLVNIAGCPRTGAYMQALRHIKHQTTAAVTDSKVIAAPGANEVGYIEIEKKLNYPAEVYWRGGSSGTGVSKHDLLVFFGLSGFDPWPGANVHISNTKIFRYDTVYSVDGAPSVTAKLGWKSLKLLEGTTTGRMTGKVHLLEQTKSANYVLTNQDYILKENDPLQNNYGTFLLANNDRAEYMADAAANWTTDYGGTNPTAAVTTTLFNERPACTMSYTLKSRYVIDYDHKGRFYAAIRCEVVCTGAAWAENLAVYEGFMVVDVNPTYTVKIYFECGWVSDGVTELLLAEETITRPAFEAIPVIKFNPWYWMYPGEIGARTCVAYTPPEPRPDENFMFQFANLASNQGVNTNLCCADVRPDITGDDAVRAASAKGIEYSYLKNNRVIPHSKYVTGQLYARTFKLSDFSEAFWMLNQLKVTTIQDDFQPLDAPIRPGWYYHPVLLAALSVNRHIEVRDGIIGTWSSELPGAITGYPPTAVALPALTDREIKLYRV